MNKTVKRILKCLLAFLIILILIIIGYVAYVFITYHRIEDNQPLEVTRTDSSDVVWESGDELTIGTYNVGFGAYLPDYSFFMDGGKYSRCYSKESGTDAINGAAKLAKGNNPDIMLFQEVDLDSTRSYHVNQDDIIANIFGEYCEVFAINYDSAYLFYPFDEPIGASKSGISTFSKGKISSSLRRSLPISTGFSKFLDLDRCYSISRIPVKSDDGEKELIVINVHLSAYGNSDEIREGQLNMLFEDMKKEADAGNYVICGGDFNHNLKADEKDTENCMSWAYPFPRSKVPSGLRLAMDDLSSEEIAALPESGRNDDMEYIPGKTELFTLDGFIVSDNIEVLNYDVIYDGFAYSDHEPVFMKFKLK